MHDPTSGPRATQPRVYAAPVSPRQQRSLSATDALPSRASPAGRAPRAASIALTSSAAQLLDHRMRRAEQPELIRRRARLARRPTGPSPDASRLRRRSQRRRHLRARPPAARASRAREHDRRGSPASRPTSMPYERSAPPGCRRCRNSDLSPDLAHGDVVVAQLRQFVGELRQLVIVRGEYRLAADPRRAGARSPPTRSTRRRTSTVPRPISSSSTRLRAVAVCRIALVSLISTMNVDWPRTRLSLAPTRVNMRSTIPMRARARRDEAADLRHQHDQPDLPQHRRLAGHVRPGEDDHPRVVRSAADRSE